MPKKPWETDDIVPDLTPKSKPDYDTKAIELLERLVVATEGVQSELIELRLQLVMCLSALVPPPFRP